MDKKTIAGLVLVTAVGIWSISVIAESIAQVVTWAFVMAQG